MEWHVDGHVLIACNCDFGCPCNFNALPTKGDCEGGWIWAIEKGIVDGVRVDGLTVAVFADWPGAIHEGGGTAISYVDERADEAQQQALRSLVRGEAGGPWGLFINTYELRDPEPARFQTSLTDFESTLRIGNTVELELTPIRNPVSGAEVHPEVVLPEGLVTKHAKLAASKTFRVRDGVDYDHSGQYAALGTFSYGG